jgi:hypothetical protein
LGKGSAYIKKEMQITGNYKDITLLSPVSKLYVNILSNKLNKYTEEIPEEQCGFRKEENV